MARWGGDRDHLTGRDAIKILNAVANYPFHSLIFFFIPAFFFRHPRA